YTIFCYISKVLAFMEYYYEKNGATYVFAPQKGANECQAKVLDSGLKNLSLLLPNNISELEGEGAAGGLCAGLYSVYGGKIKSRFDIIARACLLEEKIAEANIVITGEGKTDEQTLMGKPPYKASELCKKHGTKCVVISGSISNVSLGDKMISLVDKQTPLQYAMKNAKKVLTDKAKLVLQ
ncbi:MAG: glycerate kinase, partial [Clostridiales bacterium]|nr:glycerate kinase [Clostridiales bacterium]